MPILRILSDSMLSETIVYRVKVFGSLIGYRNPRCIWVEVSNGLAQADVMVVTVMAVKKDFEKPRFREFCLEVARYLRETLGKSVEVVRPIDGGIESICWCPTEEGSKIYGGGD